MRSGFYTKPRMLSRKEERNCEIESCKFDAFEAQKVHSLKTTIVIITYRLNIEMHNIHQKEGQANQNRIQPPVICYVPQHDTPNRGRLEHLFPSNWNDLQWNMFLHIYTYNYTSTYKYIHTSICQLSIISVKKAKGISRCGHIERKDQGRTA